MYSFIKARSILLLISLMGAIFYIGYSTYIKDGYKQRYSSELLELANFRYAYSEPYREGTNFLRPDQGFDSFVLEDSSKDLNKPILILWGDSHAAHLYPGYIDSFGNKYKIIQLTASGCPPIIGLSSMTRPNCKEINNRVLKLIKKYKPDKVVLAGFWQDYNWSEVKITINELKIAGLKSIELVGPEPIWSGGLPRTIFEKKIKIVNGFTYPLYLKNGMYGKVGELDARMAAFSRDMGIDYLSPLLALCQGNSCLAQLNSSPWSMTAWDYGHLTKEGSIYVVSKFSKQKHDSGGGKSE